MLQVAMKLEIKPSRSEEPVEIEKYTISFRTPLTVTEVENTLSVIVCNLYDYEDGDEEFLITCYDKTAYELIKNAIEFMYIKNSIEVI
jgi:hypothetical protein